MSTLLSNTGYWTSFMTSLISKYTSNTMDAKTIPLKVLMINLRILSKFWLRQPQTQAVMFMWNRLLMFKQVQDWTLPNFKGMISLVFKAKQPNHQTGKILCLRFIKLYRQWIYWPYPAFRWNRIMIRATMSIKILSSLWFSLLINT